MAENPTSETEGMSTTITHPEPWLCVVKAEVAREVFDKEYAQRLKKAVRGHQKPGFRKGKTPRAVVEKEMGDMLRAEAVEALIPRAWMAAVMKHRLAPLTDPALENFKFEDEGPLSFDLKVEIRPEIKAEDFDGLPVRKREVEVADKDVDDVVERLRESRAEFQQVDRAAAIDDRLTLDLTPVGDDGELDTDGIIVDQQMVLGAETNMPAFNEVLAGASAGDEREVDVVYPDDHPNEQLKGRTLSFRCRVKQIAVKVLPEVDDAFAAAVEEGKTLLELRTEIRKGLGEDLDKVVAGEMDQQVLAELIRRNEVPLPPSMVERYLDQGLAELHRRNAQMGQQDNPEQDKEYREAGRSHAEQALKGMFLLDAIQSQEDIKVAADDVDERIGEIAAQNGFPVDDYRNFVNSGDGSEKERIEYDLRERRTYDFLLSRAEIQSVPADTDVLSEKE